MIWYGNIVVYSMGEIKIVIHTPQLIILFLYHIIPKLLVKFTTAMHFKDRESTLCYFGIENESKRLQTLQNG